MMNSLHSKCLEKLVAAYFEECGYHFSFDPLIKKKNPLINKKLAFSSEVFSLRCSIFFELAPSGNNAGYNTFVAWGQDENEIVAVMLENKSSGEKVISPHCNVAQKIWDPNYENRSSYFGWQPIKTRRISTKELIRNQGKIIYTEEQAMAEVEVAFNQTKKIFDDYIFGFLSNLDFNIGRKWTDIKFD